MIYLVFQDIYLDDDSNGNVEYDYDVFPSREAACKYAKTLILESEQESLEEFAKRNDNHPFFGRGLKSALFEPGYQLKVIVRIVMREPVDEKSVDALIAANKSKQKESP
jgi:hypothetical protein